LNGRSGCREDRTPPPSFRARRISRSELPAHWHPARSPARAPSKVEGSAAARRPSAVSVGSRWLGTRATPPTSWSNKTPERGHRAGCAKTARVPAVDRASQPRRSPGPRRVTVTTRPLRVARRPWIRRCTSSGRSAARSTRPPSGPARRERPSPPSHSTKLVVPSSGSTTSHATADPRPARSVGSSAHASSPTTGAGSSRFGQSSGEQPLGVDVGDGD